MKTPLRKIAVTLEQKARWLPGKAARMGTAVSGLLNGILNVRMLAQRGHRRAMQRALARKAFLETDGRYLSREEVHRRSRLC
ncbi:MAG TPA: hypothetical protein VKG84_02920 [Candidatus Acidoferrales bacterium]|nr:hypothetical protein [Candidatus Acidoferrales bacterium]